MMMHHRFRLSPRKRLTVYLWVFVLTTLSSVSAAATNYNDNLIKPGRTAVKRSDLAKRGPPRAGEPTVPLVITNRCESTIWPGLATQAGTGPGTGGFGLETGKSKRLHVAWNWQGRIWGRTNCTVNGESCACQTGDCFSKLDCEFSVSTHGYAMKFPGKELEDSHLFYRERYQLHLLSLTSLVVWV